MRKIWNKYHYCVDVDIKGFFDNVNHGKLLKQIWTLGIRDKRLICIISKMLKAEIDGEGVPEKGTPQGGLLSPLLSLIVLNELDWWVSSQWETFQPKHRNKNGWFQYAKKHTRLKSGFIVRYADDFKIMCSTYEEAQRFYHSTVDFLNKRLKLEISPEKSKVVNLKKNSSDFLGFKIKVIPKGKTKHGYVAKTDMNQKALKKAKTNLKLKVKDIVRHTTTFQIARYNLAVMGMQNYYCVATNIYNNLTEVSYALLPTTRVRFKKIAKLIPFETTSQDFQMKTTGIRPQTKIIMIADTPLLPINGVKHKNPLNFSQDICNFTEHGRSKIHEEIALVTKGEMRGRNTSYDSQISTYKVEDFAFSKLRERYKKWTGNSFDEKDLISFGLANEQGYLTNAGALVADESPIRWSRLFCTRWNGLNKSGGTIDAFDDAEYSGSVLSLIDNGEAFIKRNAKLMWRKTANSREEMPEYVERSYHEALVNALAHRLCKALHKRCYAKLIVMQRKFLFYRKQGLFSFFNLA